MDFKILGPLEVHRGAETLTIGAAKQRALLAILLLHANEVVSSDRLIDDMWGTQPPDTVANALQVYVAQLRKVLEPERPKGAPNELLLTRPGGYQLSVGSGQLDAESFERLFGEGSRARANADLALAARLLHEALALWHGPALADFTYEPFAQPEIARLDALRLAALEERIDVDLARGNHFVVGELEALIREHPLRETLRGQLMLALYRAGRQAEALEAYQDARRTLTEELGIVPRPELQRLEGAILRQDPELDLPDEISVPQPPPVVNAATPRPETRKTITVLVVGRTTSAGTDPETLRRLEKDHRRAVVKTVERHGGCVESVLGDRVAAVFGVPHVREDDALRAVSAAVELHQQLDSEWELAAVRTGIATGEVVTGDPESGEDSLTGEPIALAAQLEIAAQAGEIVLSEATRRLLGEAARVEPADGADHCGWRLLELVPRPPPLTRPPRTPIIGRDAELAQFQGALDRAARERTTHLFTVVGAAGIGKSRLGEEFAFRAAAGSTVVGGRCVAYGEGITFWPLREIVGQLTADVPLSVLVGGNDDTELITDRLTEAIGLAEATSSLEEIFWAFRMLFEAAARERPLVVLFEDLHWAEPTLLDFIEYLSERARGVAILLVCLARPELPEVRPAWGGGQRNASSVFLEGLTESESEQLIDTLAVALPETTRAVVLETAEGNPLFLEQILAMLSERNAPEGEIPIPPTIQAVLAARLDRLGPGERAVIERAAIIGRDFWEDAVVDLLPDDARSFTVRHLEGLVRKDFLHHARARLSGEDAFRFQHALIQQATYRAIPKRLRATLHERVAAWLEERFGESTPEFAETAGYHLEQTYLYRAEIAPTTSEDLQLAGRAAGLLSTAGRRAFRRGDMPAAVNLLRRSVSLLVAEPFAGLELLPDLGYALFEIGELDRADAVLGEAIEKARACGNRWVETNAAVKHAHVRIYTDPENMAPESLIRDAIAAIEVLDELGDDLGLARAWTLLSEANWPRGEMAEVAKAARRAAEHARRAGSRREEAWGLGEYAFALLYGPTPATEGIRTTEFLLREAAGNLVMEAVLSGFLALLEAMRGRVDEARAHNAQSRRRLHDLGLGWQAAVQDLLGGYIELLAGAPVAAERHMRAARDSFIAIGDRWFLSTVLVDLPRPVYEQGRYREARALVRAIAEVPAPADQEWQIKRRGIQARLLAREGRVEQAERLAREAVAIAAKTDLVWFHGDALIDLAEVLELAGQLEEASGVARDALALYERKGNVVSAATTRTLIQQLQLRSMQ